MPQKNKYCLVQGSVVTQVGFEAGLPECEAPALLLSGCVILGELNAFLGLIFLICKMEIIIVPTF